MTLARIESIAYGGNGVARVDGLVHFVPLSAPGDLLEIEPAVRKKRYSFSRLIRVVEPSPLRTEPFCPYYGECGGCQFQHLHYSDQLQLKQKIFVEQMKRIGKRSNLHEPEIHGSESKRVRMRFQVRDGRTGLFKRKSHDVYPIDTCGIASSGINRLLGEVRKLSGPETGKSHGEITILAMSDEILVFMDLHERYAQNLCDLLSHDVKGCIIRKQGKRMVLGQPYLAVPVRNKNIFQAPDLFGQVNPEINQLLVDEICQFMNGMETVLDLYCGCGNITLPLSEVCQKAVGIERDRHSLDAAQYSVSRESICNVSFHHADALDAEIDQADGVVLDPPRAGLPAQLIRKIGTHKPGKIAYVSCNPSTLARDLHRLMESGYSISSVQLFDMFPHTYHIESLVLLERE
jgi:23S rRNA (uracil1939-C5)-methyltransferase